MPAFWIDIFQNGSSQTYPFDAQSVTFGRDKSADFVLDHPTVSRQHGRIVRDHSGGFRLQVLSQGGLTALNGQRVQGEVPIQSGASINFGQIQLVFRAEGAPAAQAGGFGQPPQSGGNFGAPPGGNLGAPPGGNFGAPPTEAATPSQQAPSSGNGAMGFGPSGGADEAVDAIGGAAASHWAAYADEMEADMYGDDGPDTPEQTDFEKMAAAAAKTDDGVNPVLIVAVVIAAGFAAYTVFAPPPSTGGRLSTVVLDPLDEELPVKVKCLSKDDCLEKAIESYKIGKDNYEKKSIHISNLFDSYKKMLEAKAYLAEEELPMPDELKGLEEQEKLARDELDKVFTNYRVSYVSKKKVEMYGRMVMSLSAIQSHFPDKAAPEYKWAEKRIVQMKADGVYPKY